jgi:hypothetical protein
MTRKHFEALAAIFANHPAIKSDEVRSIGWEICDYLETQNPNFNRAKWLDAAGIYKEES